MRCLCETLSVRHGPSPPPSGPLNVSIVCLCALSRAPTPNIMKLLEVRTRLLRGRFQFQTTLSKQPAVNAMDAISALDTAMCIVAITEFITELLSDQPPLSPDGKDDHTILETFKKLRTELLETQTPSVSQQSSLRDLVSSRDASAALMEDIEKTLKRPPDEPGSRPLGTDLRAWLRYKHSATSYNEKLQQLPYAVTHQAKSILMWVVQIPSSRAVSF